MGLKPIHPQWTIWAFLASLLPCTAQATNGYFALGYSASQNALGGTGTALTEDALVASINPAGTVWIGKQLDINFSLFLPRRGFTATDRGEGAQNGIFTISPGSQKSDNLRYYIPGVGYTSPINDVSSWGIVVYGNGGLNTEYHNNSATFAQNLRGFQAKCEGSFGGGAAIGNDNAGFCGKTNSDASVDLIQLFIVPNYSYKLGEKSSIGIAPLFAGQRFKAIGLQAFGKFSNEPTKVSDNGSDISFGYGARIGFLTGLVPGIGLGASYQTRVRMSRFRKYSGLFAEKGSFDIPSTWNLGISLHFTDDQRLAFDYQRINFSEVAAVGNPLNPNRFINACGIPRLFGDTAPKDACLGSDNGPGFGWRDVDVYKFGYQIKFAAFKFRVGYSYGHQPIPESEVLFNILAPAVPKEHFTAGLSYKFSEAMGFDLGAMYVKGNPVRGKNPLSNTNATEADLIAAGTQGSNATENSFGADPNDQDIIINLRELQITFGVTYRY